MCCCEEKQGQYAVPVHHVIHQSGSRRMCGCGCHERRFQSKKERIETLEEYMESLKSELVRVEEELKSLQTKC